MVKTIMPRDDSLEVIPVLRFRAGSSQSVMISGSANTSSQITTGTRVITLLSNVDAFFETGNVSVTATTSSHFIPAGIPYDMALGSGVIDSDNYHSYVSLITSGAAGIAYISERE